MSKPLVIVESPTKAKTISKFLGGKFDVLSTYGHIRDLPKKEMGVDTTGDFSPTYKVPDRSKDRVKELKKAAEKADQIYLATDEDREGEAIAWHAASILEQPADKLKRITFHEITEDAIEEAMANPREIDEDVVNAQQARRILDRLVGYELSPFLWKKVKRGLSAGRVQSVALRLIVERERERIAFEEEEYWSIKTLFEKDDVEFPGKLRAIDGKRMKKMSIGSKKEAHAIVEAVKGASFAVTKVKKKEINKKPPTPFTTSRLQIEANRKLRFSAKQTMAIAQQLYETGRITYMRTDSLALSKKFLGASQKYIRDTFGDDYANGPRTFKTKSKAAQEAHEAIRPTNVFDSPKSLKGDLKKNQWKLYDLIWRRTMASQLPKAKVERTSVDVTANDHVFRSNGSIVKFDGFMKVYKSAKEKILPKLKEGDDVNLEKVTPKQHFTQPPPRYSDARLVKVLEEHEIGRPSTYAPTIDTLLNREYVERDKSKKLAPKNMGFIVNDVLVEHFPNIVDYEFTADMENKLDEIADGEREWVPMIKDFYDPFHENLEEKDEALDRSDVMKETVLGEDPESGKKVIARTGRYGPYVQLGEWKEEDREEKKNKPKSVSLLDDMRLEDLTLEDALSLLALPRTVGKTEDDEEIIALIGRYGPYLKAGKATASLPEDEDPREVGLETARALIKKAKEDYEKRKKPIAELGEDPESGDEILVKNGRYGPYVTDGTTNASIQKGTDPESIDRETAIKMLEKKRNKGKKKKKKK